MPVGGPPLVAMGRHTFERLQRPLPDASHVPSTPSTGMPAKSPGACLGRRSGWSARRFDSDSAPVGLLVVCSASTGSSP